MEQSANCAPVCGVKGRALTASVLTLDAEGPQEKYLLNNDSKFLPTYDQSAPNAIFQRRTRFGQPGQDYFGSTVKHVFKPREMGDILSNMYLQTRMPSLKISNSSSSTFSIPGEVCVSIPPSSNTTIIESELQYINIGESKFLPYAYTEPTKDYSFDVDRNEGSNVLANTAIGFMELNGAIIGTREFNEEVFRCSDENSTFDFSCNISSERVNF